MINECERKGVGGGGLNKRIETFLFFSCCALTPTLQSACTSRLIRLIFGEKIKCLWTDYDVSGISVGNRKSYSYVLFTGAILLLTSGRKVFGLTFCSLKTACIKRENNVGIPVAAHDIRDANVFFA